MTVAVVNWFVKQNLTTVALATTVEEVEIVGDTVVKEAKGSRFAPNFCFLSWIFNYASTVLAVVILSICLSVTHVRCEKTKQCNADILIQHKRAITLVF